MIAARFWLVLSLAVSLVGCGVFDPPPKPSVDGLENGVMTTSPDAPFKIQFSEAFVKSSLKLKLVRAVTDSEGNLLDEGPNPDPEKFKENTLVAYDAAHTDDVDRTFGGTFELADRDLTILPEKAFSVSVPYAALIEPGLEDLDGNKTVPRIRIPFTFQLQGGGPTKLPTGYYYFVMNVNFVGTQIQTYTYMRVTPETGIWRAIFTNGNRLEVLNSRPGCPGSCPSDKPVCALLPTPGCVIPSEKQTALDQFVDFLPDPNPPNGYTFVVDGFARDEATGNTAWGTAPFLIDITIGSGGIKIQAENTRIVGEFKEEDARWHATGSLNVESLKLNGTPSGGDIGGTFEAMSLSDAEKDQVESFGAPIPTDLGE